MELQVTSLDGKKAGSVTLSDAIFGLEPRADLIHRCVVWQLAKRQRGTHEVKNRADIHRTGKKMYRQKGTGSARHGSARVNLFVWSAYAQSRDRPAEKGTRAGVAPRALGQGQGRRHHRDRDAGGEGR
jgi:Ribosomal protein L4/L1 family